VELIFEELATSMTKTVTVPVGVGGCTSLEAIMQETAHLERVYNGPLGSAARRPGWARPSPSWRRFCRHWTSYVFNDYARVEAVFAGSQGSAG